MQKIIINYKKMIPLTVKEIKSYHSKKFVLYVRNDLVLTMTINIIKSEIIVIILGNVEELLMIFVI